MAGDCGDLVLSRALKGKRAISLGSKNTGHYLIIIQGFTSYNPLLKSVEEFFLKKNFIVFSFNSNALENSNERIANDFLKKFITQFCTDKSKKIFFVSYSNGCDVLIRYLKNNPSLLYAKNALINPPLYGLRFKVAINALFGLFRFDIKNFDKLYRDTERLSNFHKIRIWNYGTCFWLKSQKSINLDIYEEYNSQKLIREIYEYFVAK